MELSRTVGFARLWRSGLIAREKTPSPGAATAWTWAGDAPSDPRAEAQVAESALIERAQRGDRNAFSALMDLYRERVVRLGLHMVGSADDAQDLCQETFVRVYRAL